MIDVESQYYCNDSAATNDKQTLKGKNKSKPSTRNILQNIIKLQAFSMHTFLILLHNGFLNMTETCGIK